MGQLESRVPPPLQRRREEGARPTAAMSWEDFARCVRELNNRCRNYRSEKNEYFCFALKKGSVQAEKWQKTAQICCLAVDGDTDKYRLVKTLTFRDFCNVYHTFSGAPIKDAPVCPHVPAEGELPAGPSTSTAAIFNSSTTEEGKCCVCFERTTDVLLPCLHSFCTVCVIQWNEYRTKSARSSVFMCPICKAEVKKPMQDSWEVPEIPDDDFVLEYFSQLAPPNPEAEPRHPPPPS